MPPGPALPATARASTVHETPASSTSRIRTTSPRLRRSTNRRGACHDSAAPGAVRRLVDAPDVGDLHAPSAYTTYDHDSRRQRWHTSRSRLATITTNTAHLANRNGAGIALPRSSSSRLSPNTTSPSPPACATGAHLACVLHRLAQARRVRPQGRTPPAPGCSTPPTSAIPSVSPADRPSRECRPRRRGSTSRHEGDRSLNRTAERLIRLDRLRATDFGLLAATPSSKRSGSPVNGTTKNRRSRRSMLLDVGVALEQHQRLHHEALDQTAQARPCSTPGSPRRRTTQRLFARD